MSKKEVILKAAARLFSEKGFKYTSMAELSRITGAAEGTIFYHFKNKEELLLSILERIREIVSTEIKNHFRPDRYSTGMEMIDGVISFYLGLPGKMEAWFFVLHRHYTYDLAAVNPVCKGHVDAIFNSFLDLFESAIIEGQKDGTIADLPARKTACIIFAAVDGLIRFNNYNLYNTNLLYKELIASCRRVLNK
ncbi:MAG: TetR/AcrR family transcriptional regulator [Desulfobacterales bacterium]